MILVTTPTGNIGHHVVDILLRAGKQLRLFVRDAEKLSQNVRNITNVVEGNLHDVEAFTQAATGASAVFFCVPQSSDTEDVRAYYESFSNSATAAFKAAGVTRIVTISGGRGNTSDSGPNGPLAPRSMLTTIVNGSLRTFTLPCTIVYAILTVVYET